MLSRSLVAFAALVAFVALIAGALDCSVERAAMPEGNLVFWFDMVGDILARMSSDGKLVFKSYRQIRREQRVRFFTTNKIVNILGWVSC